MGAAADTVETGECEDRSVAQLSSGTRPALLLEAPG